MGDKVDFQEKWNNLLGKEKDLLNEKKNLINQMNLANLYVDKNRVLEKEELYAVDFRISYNQRYVGEKGMLVENIDGLVEISKEELEDIKLLLNEVHAFLKNSLDTKHPNEVFKKIRSEKMKKYIAVFFNDVEEDTLTDEQQEVLISLLQLYFVNHLEHTDDYHYYDVFNKLEDLEYNKTLDIHEYNRKKESTNSSEINKNSYICFVKTSTADIRLNKVRYEEKF